MSVHQAQVPRCKHVLPLCKSAARRTHPCVFVRQQRRVAEHGALAQAVADGDERDRQQRQPKRDVDQGCRLVVYEQRVNDGDGSAAEREQCVGHEDAHAPAPQQAWEACHKADQRERQRQVHACEEPVDRVALRGACACVRTCAAKQAVTRAVTSGDMSGDAAADRERRIEVVGGSQEGVPPARGGTAFVTLADAQRTQQQQAAHSPSEEATPQHEVAQHCNMLMLPYAACSSEAAGECVRLHPSVPLCCGTLARFALTLNDMAACARSLAGSTSMQPPSKVIEGSDSCTTAFSTCNARTGPAAAQALLLQLARPTCRAACHVCCTAATSTDSLPSCSTHARAGHQIVPQRRLARRQPAR